MADILNSVETLFGNMDKKFFSPNPGTDDVIKRVEEEPYRGFFLHGRWNVNYNGTFNVVNINKKNDHKIITIKPAKHDGKMIRFAYCYTINIPEADRGTFYKDYRDRVENSTPDKFLYKITIQKSLAVEVDGVVEEIQLEEYTALVNRKEYIEKVIKCGEDIYEFDTRLINSDNPYLIITTKYVERNGEYKVSIDSGHKSRYIA